ncbi:MAG: hypothetical protein GY869_06990 [Planctomycetes bacterium]|nr:hypothetical protein [Planctomycetota bacterium]
METNGAITNDNPLVWQFDNSEALNAIAFGFVNADESIIAKTKKRPKIIDFGTKDRDDKIIEYWCGISDYLLTTRMDYSGLVFISKKKYWIDEIATKIEAFYNKNKIRKRKGRKELNA